MVVVYIIMFQKVAEKVTTKGCCVAIRLLELGSRSRLTLVIDEAFASYFDTPSGDTTNHTVYTLKQATGTSNASSPRFKVKGVTTGSWLHTTVVIQSGWNRWLCVIDRGATVAW